jgi:hypothetical protein
VSRKAFFFGSFLLGLTKRNELGRAADETLLLFTSNSKGKSQMDPSFRWDDDQARSWIPAFAGTMGKS